MSRRGVIATECDRCHDEILLGPVSLEQDSIDDQLADAGWSRVHWQDVCPDCAEENPRERGDDDGVEYADPRDARDERRHG